MEAKTAARRIILPQGNADVGDGYRFPGRGNGTTELRMGGRNLSVRERTDAPFDARASLVERLGVAAFLAKMLVEKDDDVAAVMRKEAAFKEAAERRRGRH